MSRSGYVDDLDHWQMIKWRGQVASALRGQRGQRFLRDLVAALDALPDKRLIAGEFEDQGEVCAETVSDELRERCTRAAREGWPHWNPGSPAPETVANHVIAELQRAGALREAPGGPTEGEWRCLHEEDEDDTVRVLRFCGTAAATLAVACHYIYLTADACDEMAGVLRACAAAKRAEGGGA